MTKLCFTAALAVLASLALAACGGAGTDSGGSDATSAHSTIYDYTVTGTDGAVSGGTAVPQIDATQNNGQFALFWEANSSTHPYRVDLYVSTDNVLSSDDKAFFGRNCDQPAGDCQNQSAKFPCSFTSGVTISCAEGATSDTTQMSTYFSSTNGLPGTYYVILRVCDGLFEDCVTKAVPVEFI